MTEPEIQSFLSAPKSVDLKYIDGKGSAFGKLFVATAMDKSREVPVDVAEQFEAEMLLFFKILQSQQSEFGYRTAYEAARFVRYYHDLMPTTEESAEWFNDALDAVVVQKLLPKLHGSRGKLEGLLCALAYACGAKRLDQEGKPLDAGVFTNLCLAAGKADDEKLLPESVKHSLNGELARYPLSFDKVQRMYAKLIRDQFVTFSEA
jgi:5-methylcytosine-specific restriction protein B